MMQESIREDYHGKILSIVKDYLGPAADRFTNRQINLHIKKDPQDLQRSDIPMLAIRIRSGLMVLTRDEAVVDEAFRRVVSLGD